MGRLKTVCFVIYVVLCYFQAQGADKYTDENRPYEFGFTIDGEQHRHEKKGNFVPTTLKLFQQKLIRANSR